MVVLRSMQERQVATLEAELALPTGPLPPTPPLPPCYSTAGYQGLTAHKAEKSPFKQASKADA
jgi:hypothetical protein